MKTKLGEVLSKLGKIQESLVEIYPQFLGMMMLIDNIKSLLCVRDFQEKRNSEQRRAETGELLSRK